MARITSRKRSAEAPPEILSLQLRLLQYLKEYWRWVTFALVVLFVGLAAWGVMTQMRARKLEQAGAAMAKITPLLSKPESAAAAIKELEKLQKDYPGTPPAQEAEIFKAHLLYQTKKYPEAAKAYQALEHSRLPGFEALAAESLAYCYEAQGDLRQAAATLKPVATQVAGPWQNEIDLHLALLLEKTGEVKESAQYWKKLAESPQDPALLPYFKEKAAAAAKAK